MAWNYWLSIVPIGKMIKDAIGRVCCSVLPNFLENFLDDIAPPPPPPETGASTDYSAVVSAATTRDVARRAQRTDLNLIAREQKASLGLYTTLAGATATQVVGPVSGAQDGVKKQTVLDMEAAETTAVLENAGITVRETQPYDAAKADQYLAAYAGTPQRIKPGADVIVYEKDGKTVFVAEAKKTEVAVALDPEVEEKIAELEARKAAVTDVAAAKTEIAALEAERSAAAEATAALEAQVAALKEQRAAEEARLTAITAEREVLTADVASLTQTLKSAADESRALKLEVDGQRSVTEVEGISREDATRLREAGIVTVADLAATNATTLNRAGVGDATADRRALINAAKARLN